MHILDVSDASFATNADLASQLGYLLFLSNRSGTIIPISFKSCKARRVTSPAFAAELIAFTDIFNFAHTLSMEFGLLLSCVRLVVCILTDPKFLFDIIHKGSRTSEKRIMIYMAIASEGYQLCQISDIGFIRSRPNLVDKFNKRTDRTPPRDVFFQIKWPVKPTKFNICLN